MKPVIIIAVIFVCLILAGAIYYYTSGSTAPPPPTGTPPPPPTSTPPPPPTGTPPPPTTGIPGYQAPFIGGDWWDNDIKNIKNNDPVVCGASCTSDPNCIGFTVATDTQDCWIKSKLDPATFHPSTNRKYYLKNGQPMPSIPSAPTGTSSSVPNAPFMIGSQKSTPVNDYGGGATIFLDRHTPDCGNQPFNSLKLNRPSDTTMKFDYTCSTGGNLSNPVQQSIPPQEDGGASTIYLDRQNIQCPADSALTKLHLTRPSGSTISFDYSCAKNATPLNCRQLTTTPRPGDGTEGTQSLMSDIKCNNDEVLSRIHVFRPTPQTIAWEYTCCKTV